MILESHPRSVTHNQEEPRTKKAAFCTHHVRLKSFPFYTCYPRRSRRRLEGGGAGTRGRGGHFSSSREWREQRGCPGPGEPRGAGGQGHEQGVADVVRCHIYRLWSQNGASCLSNSISIQGDKLLCSRTNWVHFLNSHRPGNTMRTRQTSTMKRKITPRVCS